MFIPLGKLTVVSAGVPVSASTLLPANNPYKKCHAILFQALPTNLGKVYVGDINIDVGTGFYGAYIPVPSTNTAPSFQTSLTRAPNGLNVEMFWIDADFEGEGCTVSILVT